MEQEPKRFLLLTKIRFKKMLSFEELKQIFKEEEENERTTAEDLKRTYSFSHHCQLH